MEVGPLARVLMLYAKGHAQTKELVNMALRKLDLPVPALFSTLGRTTARTLETKVFTDVQGWLNQLIANIKGGDVKTCNEELWEPASWPRETKGVGYTEASRGGLAHSLDPCIACAVHVTDFNGEELIRVKAVETKQLPLP